MFVGAIDQGTSSTRFILFDRTGKAVASHQVELQQIYSHPGWVEHDAEEILASTLECIAEVMKQTPGAEVKCVGITNQRETTVVWDPRTGKPLAGAIVWLDTRTRSTVEELVKEFGSRDHFRERCGLPFSTYFSAVKYRWLLDNNAAVQQAVKEGRALFGTVDSWLLWNLSGGTDGGKHITDISNASRTMLMNLETCQWDPEICRALRIPVETLPEIRSNSEVYAEISSGALKSVPISGCLGDQHAALIGQGCFESGMAKNTYGTGCFLLLNTGAKPIPSTHGLLTTIGFQLGGQDGAVNYALEGSVAMAGSSVEWMRENLRMVNSGPELAGLAGKVPDNGGMYFVPAFSGLLAPYWRDDARGVFVGLTHFCTREHFCRAVLESVAFQSMEVFEAMQSDSGLQLQGLRVDGGLANSDLLLQFQADLLEITIERPGSVEATALGCAIAAGLAVGFWASLEDVQTSIFEPQEILKFHSSMEAERRKELITSWKKAVQRTFDWEVKGQDESAEEQKQEEEA